jgi:hypothetical protein
MLFHAATPSSMEIMQLFSVSTAESREMSRLIVGVYEEALQPPESV